jgi:hypothetical protein
MDVCADNKKLNNENDEKYQCLEKRYQSLDKRFVNACADNKKLNNDVIEIKGNIKVMSQLRPLNALEIQREDKSVIEVLSHKRLHLPPNNTYMYLSSERHRYLTVTP